MKVWALIISHRHGVDVHVHRSQAGARRALADYCRDNWSEQEALDKEPPASNDACVKQYFTEANKDIGGETWEILDLEVED